MPLEIIATTVADAIAIEKAGASRIELVTGPSDGGLTPTLALLEVVKANVDLPIFVRLRPHAMSYVFDASDRDVILADALALAKAGADGFVFGALTAQGGIDLEFLEAVLAKIKGRPLTFDRAIDQCQDLPWQVQRLSQYAQVQFIQSSSAARSLHGPSLFHDLHKAARVAAAEKKRAPIQLVSGTDLTLATLPSFLLDHPVEWIRMGEAVRLNMSYRKPIDPELLQQIAGLIRKHEGEGSHDG